MGGKNAGMRLVRTGHLHFVLGVESVRVVTASDGHEMDNVHAVGYCNQMLAIQKRHGYGNCTRTHLFRTSTVRNPTKSERLAIVFFCFEYYSFTRNVHLNIQAIERDA